MLGKLFSAVSQLMDVRVHNVESINLHKIIFQPTASAPKRLLGPIVKLWTYILDLSGLAIT